MLFHEITVEEFAEIRAREAYADGEKAGLARGAAQEKREIAKNLKTPVFQSMSSRRIPS